MEPRFCGFASSVEAGTTPAPASYREPLPIRAFGRAPAEAAPGATDEALPNTTLVARTTSVLQHSFSSIQILF
jgi:hypothetical protein